jgi:cytochrome c556
MSVSKSVRFLALSAAILFSSANFAQNETSAVKIMHERHDNFELMGESFKTIRDELRSRNADMEAITKSAQIIHDFARELHTWFPAGTGPDVAKATGVHTHAKAEIWQNKADFNAAAERLLDESGKFLALTKTGEASKVAGGVRALGGACKNCHDKYRVED